MSEPVPVRVRDCGCPGSPHAEGDVVYLAPIPSLACGLAGQADMKAAGSDGRLLAQLWLVTFVRHGALGWNFLDGRGKPLPFDVEVILADYSMGLPVADKAEELGYVDALMRPFPRRLPSTLPLGLTASSTSPEPESTASPPRRSWRGILAGTAK